MALSYDPLAVEDAWYEWWHRSGLFQPWSSSRSEGASDGFSSTAATTTTTTQPQPRRPGATLDRMVTALQRPPAITATIGAAKHVCAQPQTVELKAERACHRAQHTPNKMAAVSPSARLLASLLALYCATSLENSGLAARNTASRAAKQGTDMRRSWRSAPTTACRC